MGFFDNIRSRFTLNDLRRKRAEELNNRKDDSWKANVNPYDTIIEVFNNFSDKSYEDNVRKFFPIEQDIRNKKGFVPEQFKYEGNDYDSKDYKQKVDGYYNTGLDHETLDKLLQNLIFVNKIIQLSNNNNNQVIMRITTYIIETGYNISKDLNLTEKGARSFATLRNTVMQLMKNSPNIKSTYASIALQGMFTELFTSLRERFRRGNRRSDIPSQTVEKATFITKESSGVQQSHRFSFRRLFGIKAEFTADVLANNEMMAKIDLDDYNIISICKCVFEAVNHQPDPSDACQNSGHQDAKNNSDKALDYLAREYRKTGNRSNELRKWISGENPNSEVMKTFREKTARISQENSGGSTISTNNTPGQSPLLVNLNPTEEELYTALSSKPSSNTNIASIENEPGNGKK